MRHDHDIAAGDSNQARPLALTLALVLLYTGVEVRIELPTLEQLADIVAVDHEHGTDWRWQLESHRPSEAH